MTDPLLPARRRDLTYRTIIAVAQGGFRLLGLRITVEGAEHLPRHGAVVLASNHTSYLDFLLVGLVGVQRGRLVRFLAKESTFTNGVSGPAMRAMGHIGVQRPVGTVAALRARRALESGEVVGVFPEATVSRSWTLRATRRGASYLAARQGVPLIPMVTWGSQRVLTGSKLSLRRGRAVLIRVGEPLHDTDPVRLEATLRARLTELYDGVQADYPQTPHGPPGSADWWWVPRHLGGTAPTPQEAAVKEDAKISGASRARKSAAS